MSTPRPPSCRWSRRATCPGPLVEATVAEALAPWFGATGPAPATIDTLLLGCTHYPLLRPIIAAIVGDQVAIVDSATATASALAEQLAVNGLETPGAPASGAVHLQLTTGDAATFHGLASRLFGAAFPDVEQVELAVATR